MGSFSALGIGLSFVFGCIFIGFVAELYYLLWWKKRVNYSGNREMEDLSFLLCWKRPSCFNSEELKRRNPEEQEDLETGSGKDLGLKGYGEEGVDNGSGKDLGLKGYGEEGVDNELIRMHNLCGPPRFLFTIKEENKEDLESDDGKSRSSRKGSRTKSLDSSYLSPLSSPTVKAPHSLDSYHNHGLNLLVEAQFNTSRSSPPPKFKFLKDAEDKLIRRLLEEAERKRDLRNEKLVQNSENLRMVSQEEKGLSFGKFANQSAQVLPLPSSPTLTPVLDNKSSV